MLQLRGEVVGIRTPAVDEHKSGAVMLIGQEVESYSVVGRDKCAFHASLTDGDDRTSEVTARLEFIEDHREFVEAAGP